jgi:hypothetical protein
MIWLSDYSVQEKEFFAEVRGAPSRGIFCLSLAREGAPRKTFS